MLLDAFRCFQWELIFNGYLIDIKGYVMVIYMLSLVVDNFKRL